MYQILFTIYYLFNSYKINIHQYYSMFNETKVAYLILFSNNFLFMFREWQMERVFKTTMLLHSPHIVFFLGDMFIFFKSFS